MKAVCIVGSARSNGSTNYLIDTIIKGIAIAVRAGVRQAENDLILNSIEHYFGHLGIETVKKFSVLQTNTLDDLLTNHKDEINEIYEAGKSIK